MRVPGCLQVTKYCLSLCLSCEKDYTTDCAQIMLAKIREHDPTATLDADVCVIHYVAKSEGFSLE